MDLGYRYEISIEYGLDMGYGIWDMDRIPDEGLRRE